MIVERQKCSQCNGKGNVEWFCDISGAAIPQSCAHCNATGYEPKIYYANVMQYKSVIDKPFMWSSLFETREEAEQHKSREFYPVKTIEVRI